ncbi:MAG: GAF domain-containing protein [Gammaproteobacteria bacterium]|nr:GAF domain-containing protein [Gammaproteobacteria bacterium]
MNQQTERALQEVDKPEVDPPHATSEQQQPTVLEAATPASVFGVRASAIAELCGLLAVLVLFDLWLFSGNGYWEVEPHPFWAIVILLSVQYGSGAGLIAAVTCSLVLLLLHAPERGPTQDLYAYVYEFAHRPLFWLTAAIVVGELRVRQIRDRDRLARELAESKQREQTIAQAYLQLDDVREQLEARVAGQLRSVLSMYQAAKAVETMEPARVLLGALDNVRAVMSPQKASIFLLSGEELQAGLQSGWGSSDRFKRRLRPEDPLYVAIVERGQVLCASDPEHEAMLAGQGVLAGPLVNPDTGDVRGMLKIEDLGFLDLNLSTVELFRALCDWVGAFYANAQRYRRGQMERAFDADTQVYSRQFLERIQGVLSEIAERGRFSLTRMEIKLDDPYRLSREQRVQVAEALGRSARDALRNTDLCFAFDERSYGFSVLLPLSAVEHVHIVAERLLARMREVLPEALREVGFSYDAVPIVRLRAADGTAHVVEPGTTQASDATTPLLRAASGSAAGAGG